MIVDHTSPASLSSADSGFSPFRKPNGYPVLIVQKRIDDSSPLLQQVSDQRETIKTASFTVDRSTGHAETYTLSDVKITSIRPLGPQFGQPPNTEELVLQFGNVRESVSGGDG